MNNRQLILLSSHFSPPTLCANIESNNVIIDVYIDNNCYEAIAKKKGERPRRSQIPGQGGRLRI